ncbi:MAG: tetratricopeptide repeat protein [Alphaproteobacteria bacterium]|nr:tetratricopeptide repeat protein [Alphaproteobacteria bacterium]
MAAGLLCLSIAVPAYAQVQMPPVAPLQIVQEAAPDAVMLKISDLQARWAEIKYKSTDKDKKIAAMSALEKEAAALVAAAPARAEAKIWEAIILSTEAGFIKGLSALPKVKKAKSLLEQAIETNPEALEGSAYTSLGSLYYQVPGWPVAFGDKEKAEKYLKAALTVNPDGIDPNYFYGDYLMNQSRYTEAVPVLEKALAAPDRAGRTLADEGRRQEIRAALGVAREKIKTAAPKKSYN